MRRVDRIRAKLLALRALDRKGETFGSAEPWGGHRFDLFDWYEDWLDRSPPVDGPAAGPA